MDKFIKMDITTIITEAIEKHTPISFSKYGDGEYYCSNSMGIRNCDNDNYTETKKIALIESFKYMVDNMNNTYIGLWPDSIQHHFWQNLVNNPIKSVKYHTLLLDNDSRPQKLALYKAIKDSSLKKIYICNHLLVKAEILFNIDHMVHVPLKNWFDNFHIYLEQVKSLIKSDQQYIIMTSAGMAAKILIYELSKLFPNNIYLDCGSAFDKICTKKTSRGWEFSYEEIVNLMENSGLLPIDWDDPKYDFVYQEAVSKLGIHL